MLVIVNNYDILDTVLKTTCGGYIHETYIAYDFKKFFPPSQILVSALPEGESSGKIFC